MEAVEPCAVHEPAAWARWAEDVVLRGGSTPQSARTCEECRAKLTKWYGQTPEGGEMPEEKPEAAYYTVEEMVESIEESINLKLRPAVLKQGETVKDPVTERERIIIREIVQFLCPAFNSHYRDIDTTEGGLL